MLKKSGHLPRKGAAVFLFSLIFSAQAVSGSDVLTAENCRVIREYESETSSSFAKRFTKMAHQGEFCAELEGLEPASNCTDLKLRKRTADFHVLLRGENRFPSSYEANAASQALGQTLASIELETGLKAILDPPTGTSTYIYIVFVDKKLATEHLDLFLGARITKDSLVASERDKQLRGDFFRHFLSEDLPCVNVVGVFEDSIIRDAHIWIRNDLDRLLMMQCVAEEIFNTMGLDEGTEVENIFDYSFSHEADDTALSEFDLLLIRILYSDRIDAGLTSDQTVSAVDTLVNDQCR